jgi:ClpP class serine protease
VSTALAWLQRSHVSIRTSIRIRRQITHAASILKAVDRKPVAEVDDETLILADQAEKAIWQVRESVRELLAAKFPGEKAEELARLLSEGTWTHDYPIAYETAQSFGLPVWSDMPAEFLNLMSLYPQPVRRQPTVEYLPERRRAGDVPELTTLPWEIS